MFPSSVHCGVQCSPAFQSALNWYTQKRKCLGNVSKESYTVQHTPLQMMAIWTSVSPATWDCSLEKEQQQKKKKKKDKTFTLEMTFFLCLLAQFHGWYRKHRGVILYVSVFVWYVLWMWMLTPGISILQSQASVVHGKHPNFNYAVTKYVFSSCNDLIRTMA